MFLTLKLAVSAIISDLIPINIVFLQRFHLLLPLGNLSLDVAGIPP